MQNKVCKLAFHKDAISNRHLVNCSVTSLEVKVQNFEEKARTQSELISGDNVGGTMTVDNLLRSLVHSFDFFWGSFSFLSAAVAFTVRGISLTRERVCAITSLVDKQKRNTVNAGLWERKLPSIWNPKSNKRSPSQWTGTWAMATSTLGHYWVIHQQLMV